MTENRGSINRNRFQGREVKAPMILCEHDNNFWLDLRNSAPILRHFLHRSSEI